eukprot:gb/GECH01002769.1/.p1 GENE.gb/GECH01002769.1/~~gb/GECH01002769.1/.p1  ORF type:complete len:678 (+),score=168.84 gb/GECH01002769.1/:1-2034(+)
MSQEDHSSSISATPIFSHVNTLVQNTENNADSSEQDENPDLFHSKHDNNIEILNEPQKNQSNFTGIDPSISLLDDFDYDAISRELRDIQKKRNEVAKQRRISKQKKEAKDKYNQQKNISQKKRQNNNQRTNVKNIRPSQRNLNYNNRNVKPRTATNIKQPNYNNQRKQLNKENDDKKNHQPKPSSNDGSDIESCDIYSKALDLLKKANPNTFINDQNKAKHFENIDPKTSKKIYKHSVLNKALERRIKAKHDKLKKYKRKSNVTDAAVQQSRNLIPEEKSNIDRSVQPSGSSETDTSLNRSSNGNSPPERKHLTESPNNSKKVQDENPHLKSSNYSLDPNQKEKTHPENTELNKSDERETNHNHVSKRSPSQLPPRPRTPRKKYRKTRNTPSPIGRPYKISNTSPSPSPESESTPPSEEYKNMDQVRLMKTPPPPRRSNQNTQPSTPSKNNPNTPSKTNKRSTPQPSNSEFSPQVDSTTKLKRDTPIPKRRQSKLSSNNSSNPNPFSNYSFTYKIQNSNSSSSESSSDSIQLDSWTQKYVERELAKYNGFTSSHLSSDQSNDNSYDTKENSDMKLLESELNRPDSSSFKDSSTSNNQTHDSSTISESSSSLVSSLSSSMFNLDDLSLGSSHLGEWGNDPVLAPLLSQLEQSPESSSQNSSGSLYHSNETSTSSISSR